MERRETTILQSNNGEAFALGACAVVLWGGGPIATVYAVEQLSGPMAGLLRTLIAAAIVLPLAVAMRLPRPRSGEGGALLFAAAMGGFAGFTIIYSIGLRETTTAHAALILGASPIFTGLFGFLLARVWPRRLWWIGAGIALGGEVILILSRSGGSSRGEATLHGDLLIVVSVLCSSTGYVAGGRLAREIGSWPATAWGISIAGVLLFPVTLWIAPGTDWSAVPTRSWIALVYLAVVVSIVGYIGWYRAIGMAGVARIAPLQFAQPAVSLVLAVILFDEQITVAIAGSIVVIGAGMAVSRGAMRRPGG